MNKLKKLKFIGKDTQLKIFLVLAIIVVLIAIFAPKIIPYSFDEEVGASLTAPNGKYFFGTDQIGRDLFSRVIYGARYSIFMTMTLVFIIFVVGTVLGVTAGYFGGIADSIIMRIGDMMIAFPGLILAIAIAGLLGPSVRNAIIAISAVTWTKYARLARSMVLKIKQELYVEAAKITGSRNYSVIFIMLEIAGLSFLGFGAQPPVPEWRAMSNEGRETYTQAPWTMIYPGLAIVIVVIIFNMLGDSVRDLVDVKSE